MSDFLNNLAARALRRQEGVRPRLASVFEPPSGALAPLPAGPPEVEMTSFEPAPDAPSTIRTDAPHAAPRQDTHVPARESATQSPAPLVPWRDDSEGQQGREGVEVRPAPFADSHGLEAAGEARPHFTPAERGGEEPRPTHASAETLQRVEVVRRVERDAGAADADGRGAEAFVGTEERVRELEGRVAALEASRADERGGRGAERPASASAVPVTARPAAQPYTPASAAAPRAPERGPERSDAPPHVSVTIGRVDVRAVFPAPAQAPPAPAPRRGPTTLAEYLKRREGGRR